MLIKYGRYLKVPCGKCVNCKRSRRQNWMLRLDYENRLYTDMFNYFVTLTYDDEHLPINNGVGVLNQQDVTKFMKRFRKHFDVPFYKYYYVGEYGYHGSRPHYHVLMFHVPFNWNEMNVILRREWKLGFADIGTVTIKSINYVSGYFLEQLDNVASRACKIVKPFMRCSQRIGDNIITHSLKEQINSGAMSIRSPSGTTVSIPRRYKDKLITNSGKSQRYNELQKLLIKKSDEEKQLLEHFKSLYGDTAGYTAFLRYKDDQRQAITDSVMAHYRKSKSHNY